MNFGDTSLLNNVRIYFSLSFDGFIIWLFKFVISRSLDILNFKSLLKFWFVQDLKRKGGLTYIVYFIETTNNKHDDDILTPNIKTKTTKIR